MGTAIGQVIDYLVAGLSPVITTLDPSTAVVDNWPETVADGYLVIGHTSPDSGLAADSENAWYDLGAQRIEETFSIPCYIDLARPGPAQKPARDAAIVVLDAVVAFVRTDPTLGQILTRGRVAIASRIHLKQTEDADDTGDGGLRRAYIAFELICKNTYL